MAQRSLTLGLVLLASSLVLCAVLAAIIFYHDTAASQIVGSGTSQAVAAGYQPPIGIGTLCGFVLLLTTICGLVLIFNALGLTDGNAAFGLPAGSIRALLALGLVIVFVAVCSIVLATGFDATSDLAKQILAISSTALTTVIGFYFGTNASSDAFKNVQQVMSGSGPGAPTTQDTVAPISLDDLAATEAATRALAESIQAKLAQNATPSPEAIAQDHPKADGVDKLAPLFAQCTGHASAAGVDRDRAGQALKDAQAAGSDQVKLQAASDTLDKASSDCAQEQADFEKALAAFSTQRDAILKPVAQG